MRRREFIVALASAITLPPTAYGQSSKLPIIGFLGTTTPSTQKQWNDAFDPKRASARISCCSSAVGFSPIKVVA
jgi:hypothetical protein